MDIDDRTSRESSETMYNDVPVDARDPDEFFQNDPFGVPIFKPTMEEFADFGTFMKRMEHWGARRGLCKIIPPNEYLDALNPLETFPEALDRVVINHPIKQMIAPHRGRVGVYTQANMDVKRGYSYAEWAKQALDSRNLAPHFKNSQVEKMNVEIVKDEGKKRKNDDNFVQKPRVVNHEEIISRYQQQFPPEVWQSLEKHYWKTIALSAGSGNEPMYGADQSATLMGHVSLHPDQGDSWNMARLGLTDKGNLLLRLKQEVSGVNRPYLYFGMWKATFGWHLEDVDLFSINVVHFGAPKHWYVIPPPSKPRFEKACRELFNEEFRRCPEFMRHKGIMISPEWLVKKHGFTFREWGECQGDVDMTRTILRCVQTQGEFMVTYPYSYHAGFNYGLNCAEATNFALPSWKDVGKKASWCHCESYTVKIDVDSLLADGGFDSEGEGLAKRTVEEVEETTRGRRNARERIAREKRRLERLLDLDGEERGVIAEYGDKRVCCFCPYGEEWETLLPVLTNTSETSVVNAGTNEDSGEVSVTNDGTSEEIVNGESDVEEKPKGLREELRKELGDEPWWAHAKCAEFIPELRVVLMDKDEGYKEEVYGDEKRLKEFRQRREKEIMDMKKEAEEDRKAEEEYQQYLKEEKRRRRIRFCKERGLELPLDNVLEKPVKEQKRPKPWNPPKAKLPEGTYEAVWGIERVPKSRWDLICDICKKRALNQSISPNRGVNPLAWDSLGKHLVTGIVDDDDLFPLLPEGRLEKKHGCAIQCCKNNCTKPFHVSCAHLSGLYTKRWVQEVEIGDVKVPEVYGQVFCGFHDPKRVHERKKRAIQQQKEKFAPFIPGAPVWIKSSMGHVGGIVVERIEPRMEDVNAGFDKMFSNQPMGFLGRCIVRLNKEDGGQGDEIVEVAWRDLTVDAPSLPERSEGRRRRVPEST